MKKYMVVLFILAVACAFSLSAVAATSFEKQDFDGNTIIVYKPVDVVTERNKSALQFLDLMTNIDKYSEIKGTELLKKLKKKP